MAALEKVPYIVYKCNGGFDFIAKKYAFGRKAIIEIDV